MHQLLSEINNKKYFHMTLTFCDTLYLEPTCWPLFSVNIFLVPKKTPCTTHYLNLQFNYVLNSTKRLSFHFPKSNKIRTYFLCRTHFSFYHFYYGSRQFRNFLSYFFETDCYSALGLCVSVCVYVYSCVRCLGYGCKYESPTANGGIEDTLLLGNVLSLPYTLRNLLFPLCFSG